MNYIEKHVEFINDLTVNHNKNKLDSQQQKLYRRDTPHHLKNKRIFNKDNNSFTLDVIIFCFFFWIINFNIFNIFFKKKIKKKKKKNF